MGESPLRRGAIRIGGSDFYAWQVKLGFANFVNYIVGLLANVLVRVAAVSIHLV